METPGTAPPDLSAASRRDAALHLLCCGFIALRALCSHYLYAISDRLPLIDYDTHILQPTLENYLHAPGAHIWSMMASFFAGITDEHRYALANLLLSVSFRLFGRTSFVLRMSQVLPLLVAALAVYALVFAISRRKWAGLAAAVIFSSLPVVVEQSRSFFPFLSVCAALLWACWSLCGNLDLRDGKRCVVFASLLYLASLIHFSSFLCMPLFFIFLAFTHRCPRRYAALLGAAPALFAWNLKPFGSWFGLKFGGHFNFVSAADAWKVARSPNLPALRASFVADFGDFLLGLFVAYAAAFIALRFLGRRLTGNEIGKTSREVGFLWAFTAWLGTLYGANAASQNPMPPAVLLIFFPIAVAAFVCLVAKVAHACPARGFWVPMHAVLCLLPVVGVVAQSPGRAVFDSDNPVNSHLEVQYFVGRRRSVVDDIPDLAPILSRLASKRRQAGDAEVSVSSLYIPLLRSRGAKPRGCFTDHISYIVNPEAFLRGISVRWETAEWDPQFGIWFMPPNAPHLILTVANERFCESELGPQDILARLEKLHPRLSGALRSYGRLLTGFRLHRNVFMYVYERS